MTLWGRLEGWNDPAVALSRISVVWTVSAFGAAPGDILPGRSSARDIDDELDDIGERVGIGDEEGLFRAPRWGLARPLRQVRNEQGDLDQKDDEQRQQGAQLVGDASVPEVVGPF